MDEGRPAMKVFCGTENSLADAICLVAQECDFSGHTTLIPPRRVDMKRPAAAAA
jgi:hypothetical protein